jgi:PAS domain S-box-containing protein
MFSKPTKFESLLEAVPDALVGMDQSGVIRFVNHQSEELFGYDRDDLVGQHIETLVPEALWRIFLEHRDGYFADPRSRSMGLDLELRARAKDGSHFPVTISLSPIDTGDVLLDVTSVRHARSQKKAFEDAERMSAIVEHSNDPIIGTTPAGTVTTWNPAAERLYGYTSQEMRGRSIHVLAPKDRNGEIPALLTSIERGESLDHHETNHIRKDGTLVPVAISASPVRDEEGVIVGTSTIIRDVTQQREAYEAARAMIQSSQDSLVSISAEGKITDANEATVAVTGLSREELIGTAFSDCFTDPEKANEIYQRVFAQGNAVDYPLTLRHRDGTLTDVLYNASVHRSSAGRVLAVFAAARDVTKLREAFETARAMIESSLDSLVSINAEGRITDLNEATVKVTGRSREALLGTAFSDYFTDPEKANAIYQHVFADGMAVDYPLTMRHQDGGLTEVLYNASVYHDANGNVRGVFAAARDVTKQNQAQRKVAEQQLKELRRLAELETFHKLTVGRELKMIELKKENEYLRRHLPAGQNDADDKP